MAKGKFDPAKHGHSEAYRYSQEAIAEDRKKAAAATKMKRLSSSSMRAEASRLSRGRGGVRKKDTYIVTAETRAKPHRELAREKVEGQTEVKRVRAGFRSRFGRGKYLAKTYNQTKEKYIKS